MEKNEKCDAMAHESFLLIKELFGEDYLQCVAPCDRCGTHKVNQEEASNGKE